MKALLGMPYPVGTILGAIAVCMLLAGCDTSTTITPRPTPTQVSRVVPTPTLPVLGPEKGWHTVLTLGNTDGQQGIFGGSFVATKQYSISFACEGDGSLSLAFAQAKQTVPCSLFAHCTTSWKEMFMPSSKSGHADDARQAFWRISVALAGIIAALSMAACAPSGIIQPAPTVVTTVTPAPTPTLAPLIAQPGYTITVRLGFSGEGTGVSGTSFVATKPYEVVVSCEGNGSLVITVASPDPSTQTMLCTATPQTQTFLELFPKVGQQVHVSVSVSQQVGWIGFVAVKQ